MLSEAHGGNWETTPSRVEYMHATGMDLGTGCRPLGRANAMQ